MQGRYIGSTRFSKPDFWKKNFIAFLFFLGIGFSSQIFIGTLTPQQQAARTAIAEAERQKECLGSTLWWEARGESPDALAGVSSVVHLRAQESGRSICDTISQPHQFSWYKPGRVVPVDTERQKLLDSASRNRKLAKNKWKWFYSGKRPVWANNMLCHKIGKLTFCKMKSTGPSGSITTKPARHA